MTAAQIWNNLVAYSLQIGLLVGLGALLPPLLKLRTPQAKLAFWQALLVACIVLPAVQPWRQEVFTISNVEAQPFLAMVSPGSMLATRVSAERSFPFTSILLYVLAAGAAIRFVWLCVGLARLAGYRRRGQQLPPDPLARIAAGVKIRLLISDEIPSPVTFGWRDPVVLLPARFLRLRPELREAILCHELTHVERNDWLITLAEEAVRAMFWFHPAVWWVLGEIQLSREQTVDCSVVDITRAREYYLDALLAMAAPTSEPTLDLAPAPLFLKRRHLKRRIAELLQEVQTTPLSGVRVALAMAAIAGGCSLVSGAFPLAAAPQFVADDAGVAVDTGDAKLRHRTPVAYPAQALARGVEGKVEIRARVDADGAISSDTEVECLRQELCDAALTSLPNWTFDLDQANTTHEITIDFVNRDFAEPSGGTGRLNKKTKPAKAGTPRTNLTAAPQMDGAMGGAMTQVTFISRTVWLDGAYVVLIPASAPNAFGHPLSDIRIAGLSRLAASQLKSRLPVQTGDVWSGAIASIVSKLVADFNPHLEIEMLGNPKTQDWSLWIGPGLSRAAQTFIGVTPLAPGVKPPALLARVDPAYTDGAKSARISGSVSLSAVVNADGKAENIQVTTPLDPGLDQAAMDALSKWRFRPGTKDGAAVSVPAQVNFSFRLM